MVAYIASSCVINPGNKRVAVNENICDLSEHIHCLTMLNLLLYKYYPYEQAGLQKNHSGPELRRR